MTTAKQNKANQKNALLSTGPVSEEGKEIVCLNAIKHGIFAKDLIISSGIGKENEKEYYDLLQNLVYSLQPKNQMEVLLVEKISIDFWRLRRVIKFEGGSIKKHLDEILKEFYSYNNKDNKEIDKEIENKQSMIVWNNKYIKLLEKGLVNFNQAVWKDKDIKSDILEDFYFIARSIEYDKKSKAESDRLYNGDFDFIEIKALIKKYGYGADKEISSKLIEIYLKQNEEIEEDIQELELKKTQNIEADELNTKICSIPQDSDIDKIMKYEKSIQKSIFQNLLLLKKLQHEF
jgi:hypothetical protein